MNDKNRSAEEAYEIARRRVYKYILAKNLMFASREGSDFDVDDVYAWIEDFNDRDLYFEQQDLLRSAFCVKSERFKDLCRIRYVDENGKRCQFVNPAKIIEDLFEEGVLRADTTPGDRKGSLSYRIGKYSKKYILSYDEMTEVFAEREEGYSEKFDLGSEYYKEIISQLGKDYDDFKALDFNKKETKQRIAV